MSSPNVSIGIDTQKKVAEYSKSASRTLQSTINSAQYCSSTRLDLFFISCAFIGCQMAWAVQIGHSVANLREMGATDTIIGFAWLVGSVISTFVQPIVGTLSDNWYSVHSKRRNFISAATVMVICSLVCISTAQTMGCELGDECTQRDHRIGIVVGIAAFGVIEISISTLQGPLRALITDTLPVHLHVHGNAVFAFQNGIGNTFGYMLSFLPIPNFEPLHLSRYLISAIVVAIASGITVGGVHEHFPADSFQPSNANQSNTWHNISSHLFSKFGRELRTMPSSFRRAWVVQTLAHFSFFVLYSHGPEWVASVVYGGDVEGSVGGDERTKFEAGVRAANVFFMIMSVLSASCSLFLPVGIHKYGLKRTWVCCLVVHSVAMALLPLVSSWKGLVAVLMSVLGLNLSCTFQVGWSIVTLSIRDTSNVGLYAACFNTSQCIAQILALIVAEPVQSVFGGLNCILVMGSIASLLAAFIMCCTVEPDRNDELETSALSLHSNTKFTWDDRDGGHFSATDHNLDHCVPQQQ